MTPSVLYDHTGTGALGDLGLGIGVRVNSAWYPKNFWAGPVSEASYSRSMKCVVHTLDFLK